MKRIFLLIIFIVSKAVAQVPDKEGSLVHWMTLEQAMEKQMVQPKPMFIDFYTDWCGWCKRMMATTYANPQLAQYIDTYFYPVKFDAEGKDTIEYLGQKYAPTSDQPRTTHPLAAKLLGNKLMYPTTLFMNGFDKTKNEFALNMIASGYLEEQKLEPILVFVLENAGRNSSFDDFRDQFQFVFYDSTYKEKKKEARWIGPDHAFDKKVEGKKTLVLINTEWCTSCKVMKASFIDSTLKKYLSEKFILVDFNPEITDTIIFKGQKYYNPKNQQSQFHQLAFLLGRNSLTFPSLIVVDENQDPIDVIPSYISPHFLDDIAHFYGDNIYKTKTWAEYAKERKKVP